MNRRSNTSFSSILYEHHRARGSQLDVDNSSIWEHYSVDDLVDVRHPVPHKPQGLRDDLQQENARSLPLTLPVSPSSALLDSQVQALASLELEHNQILNWRSSIPLNASPTMPPYHELPSDGHISSTFTVLDRVSADMPICLLNNQGTLAATPPDTPAGRPLQTNTSYVKPQPSNLGTTCHRKLKRGRNIAFEQNAELFFDAPAHFTLDTPPPLSSPHELTPLIVLTPPEETDNNAEWLKISIPNLSPRLEEYRMGVIVRARKIDIALSLKERSRLYVARSS